LIIYMPPGLCDKNNTCQQQSPQKNCLPQSAMLVVRKDIKLIKYENVWPGRT